MAGFGIDMAGGAPAGPPRAGGGQAPQMAEGEAASPEEQAAYEKFVSMALLHMHDDAVRPGLVEQMRKGDPVRAIGQAAATLGMTLIQKARDAGEDIPVDVILHGGAEVVDALVEIAEAAGIGGGEISEEDAERAYLEAADEFRDAMGGEIDPAVMEEDARTLMGREGVASKVQGFAGARG